MSRYRFIILALLLIMISCESMTQEEREVLPGIYSTVDYIDLLQGKKVGVVANQASIINNTHLVDTLSLLGIDLRAIYCPEHGFRGDAEAGAMISSYIDPITSLPIVSLYGNNKKPNLDEFANNDIIIFDLQDVGTRFYTYISTLHYVMEASAELDIPIIVLDRPNPNAHYVDGPVLKDPKLVSFVGLHPVPIVYGMTIGEYAKMINGEKWLGTSAKRVAGEKGSLRCELSVIPIQNYNHNTPYSLPIPPSPNLRTDRAICLYPSLCWFEGSPVSVGRGTDHPFEIIGFPEYKSAANNILEFTPRRIKGVSENPPHRGVLCRGYRLDCDSNISSSIDLSHLIEMYNSHPQKQSFFWAFFDKLSGDRNLKLMIKEGRTEEEIKASWANDLEKFRKIREKYLIY